MPTVSVIIPTHNRMAMLQEAIASVQAQRYRDWELIVVDDGSSDGTPQAMQRVVARDRRVRYERTPGLGVARARNQGLVLAQGAFIGFLDDDDLWLPDKLVVQVGRLNAQPSLGFLYTPVTIWHAGRGAAGIKPQTPQANTYENLLRRNFITTTSPLIRRECLERVGGFDPLLRQAADYDLWLRLARWCAFGSTAKPLVIYRVHGDNMTTVRGRDYYEEHVRIFEKVLQEQALPRVPRRLAQRRLAREWYLLGKASLSERGSPVAFRAFRRALRIDPTIGASFVEPTDAWVQQGMKLVKPYGAMAYAWLGGLRRS